MRLHYQNDASAAHYELHIKLRLCGLAQIHFFFHEVQIF